MTDRHANCSPTTNNVELDQVGERIDHAHQGVRANVVCANVVRPDFVYTTVNVTYYEMPCGRID